MFGNPNTPRRLAVAKARYEAAEKSAQIAAYIRKRIEMRQSFADLEKRLREVDKRSDSR